MFNILNKSFPIIVFDESLSFLYEGYIPYASQFIKEISKEFSLAVFMSTHQVMFGENADIQYSIRGKSSKKVGVSLGTPLQQDPAIIDNKFGETGKSIIERLT